MPMLDEVEFARVSDLYAACIRATQQARVETGQALADVSMDARFEPVRSEYERLTGFVNCHHNAVMHHRLSLLGPPCVRCGKPLRSPRARHCAACGQLVPKTN
ncbi:MAG: hypothetical protein U0228_12560 [Myxococcaceae bacterium]